MIKFIHRGTNYFQTGKNPILLFLSGIHGDEFEVVNSVKNYLDKDKNKLPPFLFIPEMSPSAIAKKTRINQFGKDLNRQFFDDSKDKEALNNMEIMGKFRYQLCLSFHEDLHLDKFYLYDTGKFSQNIWQKFKQSLSTINISMYNGIDDEDDPVLGFLIRDGYYYYGDEDLTKNNRTVSDWLISNNIAGRVIVAEIPGRIEKKKKHKTVEIIFEKLVRSLL